MGVDHENGDHGAESDTFRDCLSGFDTKVISDKVINDKTVIEYICGEGNPPFTKYRYTLEAIGYVNAEEYSAFQPEGEKENER
jgi:hypothetical protein